MASLSTRLTKMAGDIDKALGPKAPGESDG